MQFVSDGDNVHDVSNPVSEKKKKHKKNIVNLSSAELAERVVTVNNIITKTRLFKYIENFISKTLKNFK